MASFVWTSVFVFLCLELLLTLILVVPVPLRIRNLLAREIFKFHLGDRLKKPILFVGIALCMALMESYFTHQRILARLAEQHGSEAMHHGHQTHSNHFHDKERKYKSERNMYLAGFALTLLFVLGRITQLMQESVELEAECDRVKKFVKDSNKNASASSEPTPVESKKKA
jgi:hypothetical protein